MAIDPIFKLKQYNICYRKVSSETSKTPFSVFNTEMAQNYISMN